MTSEIIIVNKNAIVMAADSAVTVGGSKTYTGVNKLFMLSNNPPMGIMIFGAADFENIPMETLIKEYNKKTDFNEKNDIISIKDDFLEFLGKNTPNSDFESKIKYKLNSFKEIIIPIMKQLDDSSLVEVLESRTKKDLPSFLKDYDEIINDMDMEFKEMIPENIKEEYHDEIILLLKNIFITFLLKTGTGIVIAGFNEKDMFPSIVNFNLIMNNNGKIEIDDYNELFNFNGNKIMPFAQQDVINTFLKGINSNMSNAIVNYFNNYIDKYLEELRIEFNSDNKIKKESHQSINEVLNKFDKTNDKRASDFEKDIDNLKKNFYNEMLESIGSLPKKELANMAESLIHITSLKRKLDSDLETVGGDIDVAIISKGDGFIWIKRKNYYDINLNPHIS